MGLFRILIGKQMSEWTGTLYYFYSNKQISAVFNTLKTQAMKMSYQFDYHEYNLECSLLFYTNAAMLKDHMDNGYNTAINGQGCFGVEAKKVKLDGKASLFEFEQDTDFQPYDINLMFDQVFYYRLVTPDSIDDCRFSAKAYQLLQDAIRNTAE